MRGSNEVVRMVSTTKLKGLVLPMIILYGLGFLTGSLANELAMINNEKKEREETAQ